MKPLQTIAAVVFGLLILAGCYRSPDIDLHQPGVYKGADDPLLAKLKRPEVQQELVQRFQTVQTDR